MRTSFFLSLVLVAACGGATADPTPTKPVASAPPPAAALVAPDAPTATWCDGQTDHAFCADFDGEYAADGWQVWTGGPLLTVPSDRSSPSAFGLQMPAWQDTPPPKSGTALMKKLDHRGPKQVSVAFDLRVDASLTAVGEQVTPVSVYLATELGSSPYAEVDFEILRTGASLQAFAVTDDEAPDPNSFATSDVAAPPSGKWARVVVELFAGDGGATRASLSYDGVPAGSLSLAAFDTSLIDSAYLLLGDVGGSALAQPFVAAIDNVVVDLK
ncbi:MAG TPA: hypothetical protein VIF62_38840 [Labilithrix sp.]